jgi:hypothetical protein
MLHFIPAPPKFNNQNNLKQILFPYNIEQLSIVLNF